MKLEPHVLRPRMEEENAATEGQMERSEYGMGMTTRRSPEDVMLI